MILKPAGAYVGLGGLYVWNPPLLLADVPAGLNLLPPSAAGASPCKICTPPGTPYGFASVHLLSASPIAADALLEFMALTAGHAYANLPPPACDCPADELSPLPLPERLYEPEPPALLSELECLCCCSGRGRFFAFGGPACGVAEGLNWRVGVVMELGREGELRLGCGTACGM